MNQTTIRSTLTWLDSDPSLDDLCERFPAEWKVVESQVSTVARDGGQSELATLAERASKPIDLRTTAQRGRRTEDLVHDEVRRRMTVAMVREIYVGMSTGATGTVRLNRFNGRLLQRTLFEHGLVRKPVTLKSFHKAWRLAWQRRRLMALVQPKGIYCFYSAELIDELVSLIGERSALEIGAGDGTLSRFVLDAGGSIVATDDHSWTHAIEFPDFVRKQDAGKALRSHQPQVVICSWPPLKNRFERDIFTTRTVETYLLITSRNEFEAGNWDLYDRQTNFEMVERPDLGRLVLPPEIDPVVIEFRRVR